MGVHIVYNKPLITTKSFYFDLSNDAENNLNFYISIQ